MSTIIYTDGGVSSLSPEPDVSPFVRHYAVYSVVVTRVRPDGPTCKSVFRFGGNDGLICANATRDAMWQYIHASA